MKNYSLLIIGILVLQFGSSCKAHYPLTELNNIFTSEEINDLTKITEFFKIEMCLNMDTDFETCYRQIPHEYLEATGMDFGEI